MSLFNFKINASKNHRCANSRTSMIPELSPYGLIQESLWPDEWKSLVACMMLNCTTRKQIEKVLPAFFSKWSDPKKFLKADELDVVDLIKPLGFQNRRTQRLFEMTRVYDSGKWNHASDLPGIGEYAARSWEIFFKNKLGDDPPKDHALVLYWKWRKKL